MNIRLKIIYVNEDEKAIVKSKNRHGFIKLMRKIKNLRKNIKISVII